LRNKGNIGRLPAGTYAGQAVIRIYILAIKKMIVKNKV